MSIQYTAPGFEPTTFRTSHNHYTRAPALICVFDVNGWPHLDKCFVSFVQLRVLQMLKNRFKSFYFFR